MKEILADTYGAFPAILQAQCLNKTKVKDHQRLQYLTM